MKYFLILIITLSYSCSDNEIINPVKDNDELYFIPLEVGHEWNYRVDILFGAGPEYYRDEIIVMNWKVTSKLSDSLYVLSAKENGTKIISSWIDSISQIVPYDTQYVSEEYEFKAEIIDGAVLFNGSKHDFDEFSIKNTIPYKSSDTIDTLYIKDTRLPRNVINYMKLVRGKGVIEKFRDEGSPAHYFSEHIKILD